MQFFLITNFGSWMAGHGTYSRTLSGVMACYAAGVPFFWRTLASDLVYSGLLFGLHAWLSRTVSQRERVTSLQAA